MVRFELCFQLGDSQEYIVPELLPPSPPPYAWNGDDNLRFAYQYDFMPAGIITRFIARNHHLIAGQGYWRYGALLAWEGTRAQVVSDPQNRRIRIAVEGEDRKGLLAIVRSELGYIHRTLNDPDVNQLVPCTCTSCTAGAPGFFDYRVLRRYKEKAVKEIRCENSLDVISVDQLLTGIYSQQEIATAATSPEGTAGEVRQYYVQNYYETRGSTMSDEDRRARPGPWASGGFYLVAFLTTVSGLGALGNWV